MASKTNAGKTGTAKTASRAKRSPKKVADEATLSDLSSLIPDPDHDYISRKVGGVRDLDIMDKARRMRHNVLVYGPTGPGKTTMVMAYAAEQGLPFYSIPCNGAIDPRQLFGTWVPTSEQGKYEWVDGPVTAMVRAGRGVLLLNEVNFMPPRIGASFYSLLDSRREMQLIDHKGEVLKVKGTGLLIVADFNPDYEGTRPLNEAFRNRFAFKLDWGYETAVEKQLVVSDSLLTMGQQLRAAYKKGEIDTPISTNMLMEFEDIASEVSYDFAVANFIAAFAAEEQPAVREVLKLNDVALRQEVIDFYDDASK